MRWMLLGNLEEGENLLMEEVRATTEKPREHALSECK